MIARIVMKQYVIDELQRRDYDKIKSYMKKNHKVGCINGIYGIYINEKILTDEQASHRECAPFYFAIELKQKSISCEFLVRAKNIMRCSCIRYANKRQREWLIEHIDSILNRLDIMT